MVKKMVKPKATDAEYQGPKRARSAYFIFCDENRGKVMEDMRKDCEKTGTSFKVTAVGSAIAAMWKLVAADEKSRLEQLAKTEKTSYTTAFEQWKITDKYKLFQKHSVEYRKKEADKKAKTACHAAGMPKKPANAYMMFAASIMESVIEELKKAGRKAGGKDRTELIKPKWDAMSAEERKTWTDKQAEAKVKYDHDLEAFKQSDAYKEYEKQLSNSQKNKDKGLVTAGLKRPKSSKKKVSGERAAKRQKVDGKEPEMEESPDESPAQESEPEKSEEDNTEDEEEEVADEEEAEEEAEEEE